MPHKDPEQRRAYFRAYREAHKEELHGRSVACHRRVRHERYVKIRAIKEGSPCTDCGKKRPYFVMDFDHRDPAAKVADVSFLVKTYVPWNRVLEEIAKCDLVCACCHRLRTYKGQNCYKTRRYEHQRAVLDELKSTIPCIDCGKSFKPCQMDFDHVDPCSKENNIARLVGGPVDGFLEELSKCHLVCANCHRIREHTGTRPEAPGHSAHLVAQAKALLEAIPVPADQRLAPFPLPHLLGVVPDKELAAATGMSREMVAWHRRRVGTSLNRQGERIQP